MRHFRKKALGAAIGSTVALMGLGSPAFAQEATIEEVTITGTNIPRPISDAPQPITQIDALDIQLAGVNNLSDLLRSSSFNSFGSFRERSGSSFGQIATVDLKGLGAEYTAVLINGRRVPGSPLTGASIVDLNTVPLSAVESIEILKDSASAIYGADAIGGVISINLKDDFEGFEFGGGLERPSLAGADSEAFHVLWGTSHSRGNILIGAEVFKKQQISDADRPYSRANTAGPDFGNTEGVSVGGNTGFETDFSAAFPLGSCDTSLYAGVFTNPFGLGDTSSGCGFAYANISLQTGNVERKSVFLSSNYELDDSTNWYFDARFNNNETFGRYAPAVGFFSFPASSPFNTLGRDIDAFHRFVGHGNRTDSVDVDEITLSTGVTGKIGNIGYDAHIRYFDYSGAELGNTYVQTSVLEAEVLAGNYNVFDPLSQDPIHLGAVERSGVQLSRDLKTEDLEIGVTFNGTSFDMAGGQSGWAFGLEWADQDYTDIYDQFREALDVLGSAGNSASGDRTRYAAFGEFRLPVTDSFEINVAGRYDDYDDVGAEFSPQINGRWTVNDSLTLRASWGEGFKAPNLIDLHQSLAESFDDLADQVRCSAQGVSAGNCPTFQVQNFSGGNTSLVPEESESFNIGGVVQLGNFAASMDYYTVEITSGVTSLSLDQVNQREGDGTLPDGVIVRRGASAAGIPGAIIDITNPLTNGASLETSGLDIGLNYGFDTGAGDVDLNLTWVHIFDYDQQTTPDSPVDQLIGTEDGSDAFPENRVNTSFRYTASEGLTLTWNMTYIDSFRNVSDTDSYDSWLGHDVTVNWLDPFGLEGFELTGGVLNLTEEGPSIDPNPSAGYNDSVVLQLYPVAGRIPFLNFKYRFGQ